MAILGPRCFRASSAGTVIFASFIVHAQPTTWLGESRSAKLIWLGGWPRTERLSARLRAARAARAPSSRVAAHADFCGLGADARSRRRARLVGVALG